MSAGAAGASDRLPLRRRPASLSLRWLEATSSALARNSACNSDEKLDRLFTNDLTKQKMRLFDPYVTRLSHPYHLDESTFSFRGIRNNFVLLF